MLTKLSFLRGAWALSYHSMESGFDVSACHDKNIQSIFKTFLIFSYFLRSLINFYSFSDDFIFHTLRSLIDGVLGIVEVVGKNIKN